MKELSFEKMEELNGGSCTSSALLAGAAVLGFGLLLATGPVGGVIGMVVYDVAFASVAGSLWDVGNAC